MELSWSVTIAPTLSVSMHSIRTSAVAVHKQHEQCRFTHATSTAQGRCLTPSLRTRDLRPVPDDAAAEIDSLLKGAARSRRPWLTSRGLAASHKSHLERRSQRKIYPRHGEAFERLERATQWHRRVPVHTWAPLHSNLKPKWSQRS
jgi:hypothetical protein